MKKVKRMMFGGIANKIKAVANNAAAKAPVPPPAQKAAMDKMLGGRPPGILGTTGRPKPAPATSPLDGIKNLPKMSGPLGKAGTTGEQNLPPGMMGLGAALGQNPKPTPTPMALGGKGLVQNAATDFLRTRPPLDISKTAGPGAPSPGMKKGGKVSSASKRADGIAVKGKTRGKMV